MKDLIRDLINEAVTRSAQSGLFAGADVSDVRIDVSRTKDDRFGDYATNAAMVLAARVKMKPRDLAAALVGNLPDRPDMLEKAEIAGPGFINFFLAPGIWHEVIRTVLRTGESYGQAARPEGTKVLLEFVSANPTGPLHVGHGRGAAVGDTLARLLKAAGFDVETEYYVNDAGNQMRILGRSLYRRFKELLGDDTPFPDNHYRGDYIIDLARELPGTDLGDRMAAAPEDEAVALASGYACRRILDGIKDDLKVFGVQYDRYFPESTLHERGEISATLEELKRRGRAEEHEGALWFSMEGDEDEKDRVLVRATGEPTYFAADAAYHLDKLRRGYGLLVDIWGSDHHGYVPRVKAAVEALGYTSDRLRVLLVQFVTLVREGAKISMSTRSGEFVTLREVLDEVGPDAARFFFLTKRCDSHLDFDLDLAKKHSKDNPVYYVQYAHARVRSIFRIAGERDINVDMTDPDFTALVLPEEMRIVKHLAQFPDVVTESAEVLEPHRITFYLMELAELFHAYYHDNRVLIEDPRVKKARLCLFEAVRTVVYNGLNILGVSAPDRM
jgi:arginyl-tRNA synthetase